MKIQLQFEDDDLEDMLTGYFRDRGFEIKNMSELREQFAQAWPEGLKVSAQTAEAPPVAATPSEYSKDPNSTLTPPSAVSRTQTVAGTPGGNPRMTASDLFDSELKGAPSREELLADNQREIQRILAQSQHLEETPPRKK